MHSLHLRQQYHFRPSPDGLLAWDVLRLIELSRDLPVQQWPLDRISELDEPYWYGEDTQPNCRSIAGHAKLIHQADLQYPIILCHQGRVMDGMHRICKALILELQFIKAVQFLTDIEPHYVGVRPDELPY